MIETTLGELVTAEPALRRMAEQNSMNAKTVYHVAKLSRLVAAESRHFTQQRAALFLELGVERESRTPEERTQHGSTVREIPAEKIAEFQRRLGELAMVSVTIDWNPLRSTDLPSAKAADLLDLGPLCELVEPSGDC